MTNGPVLIAYTGRIARAKKALWRRTGVAFPHDKGSGPTVLLDALPAGGRIVLVEPKAGLAADWRAAGPAGRATSPPGSGEGSKVKLAYWDRGTIATRRAAISRSIWQRTLRKKLGGPAGRSRGLPSCMILTRITAPDGAEAAKRRTLHQAMASRPLALTMESSLSDGPEGFFSPRSHSLTSLVRTLR